MRTDDLYCLLCGESLSDLIIPSFCESCHPKTAGYYTNGRYPSEELFRSWMKQPDRGECPRFRRNQQVLFAAHVYSYFSFMKNLSKEHLFEILLDNNGRVICDLLIAIGSAKQIDIKPCNIFSPAQDCGAASLILLHNHPNGRAWPSASDLDHTNTAATKWSAMYDGISITDDFVIGQNGYFSYYEHGIKAVKGYQYV